MMNNVAINIIYGWFVLMVVAGFILNYLLRKIKPIQRIPFILLCLLTAFLIADFITTLYGASLITTIIEHLNY